MHTCTCTCTCIQFIPLLVVVARSTCTDVHERMVNLSREKHSASVMHDAQQRPMPPPPPPPPWPTPGAGQAERDIEDADNAAELEEFTRTHGRAVRGAMSLDEVE